MKRYLILLILGFALIFCSCDVGSADNGAPHDGSGNSTSELQEGTHGVGLEIREDLIPFTLELTQTVYKTNSEKIYYRLKAKEAGSNICRGDKWILYKIEDGKKTVVGERTVEIAIEYDAVGDGEYFECEEWLTISSLCGKSTLEKGLYCLEFPVQAPDENGYYHTYAAASMIFEVVEAQ